MGERKGAEFSRHSYNAQTVGIDALDRHDLGASQRLPPGADQDYAVAWDSACRQPHARNSLDARRAASWGYGFGNSVQVSQEIDIPAGPSGAAITVSVPQEQLWERLSLEVLEDGVRIDELSSQDVFVNSEGSGPQNGSSGAIGGQWPATLLMGIPAADAVGHAALGDGPLSAANSLYAELQEDRKQNGLPPGATVLTTRLTSLADLPDRCINYSGIDLVVLPLDELKILIDR